MNRQERPPHSSLPSSTPLAGGLGPHACGYQLSGLRQLSPALRVRPRLGLLVFLLPALALVWLFLASCRPSGPPRSQTSGKEPKDTDSSKMAPGLDALSALASDTISKLSADDLARLVDPEASLRMEALRRLALVEGTWKPPEGTVPPWSRDPVSQRHYAQHVMKADHQALTKRMGLLGRMALALMIRQAGPPKQCLASHGPIEPITNLLGWRSWSKRDTRLAGLLVTPYERFATITVQCDRVTWHLLALLHKGAQKWILAELDSEAPELSQWRYEPMPTTPPFHKLCPTGADALARAILEAGKSRLTEHMAALVDPRLSALFALVTAPPSSQGTDRVAVTKAAHSLVARWASVSARTRLMVWKDLAGLVATTRWYDCKHQDLGADELAQIKKTLSGDAGRNDSLSWLTKRLTAIRSLSFVCQDQTLTVTMARLRDENCWRLLAWDRSRIRNAPRSPAVRSPSGAAARNRGTPRPANSK